MKKTYICPECAESYDRCACPSNPHAESEYARGRREGALEAYIDGAQECMTLGVDAGPRECAARLRSLAAAYEEARDEG